VLALREAGLDARSISVGAAGDNPGPDRGDLVSTLFLTYPRKETLDQWIVIARELRSKLPGAMLVTIRLLPDERDANQSVVERHVDMVLRTFEEGVAFLAQESAAQA